MPLSSKPVVRVIVSLDVGYVHLPLYIEDYDTGETLHAGLYDLRAFKPGSQFNDELEQIDALMAYVGEHYFDLRKCEVKVVLIEKQWKPRAYQMKRIMHYLKAWFRMTFKAAQIHYWPSQYKTQHLNAPKFKGSMSEQYRQRKEWAEKEAISRAEAPQYTRLKAFLSTLTTQKHDLADAFLQVVVFKKLIREGGLSALCTSS